MERTYDHYGRPEPQIIYLAKPGRHIIYALNGVEYNSVNLTRKTNDMHEITFEVHRTIDGEISNGYEEIDDFMELYCDGIWFKINGDIDVDNDGIDEFKTVTAQSYECSLMQYDLVGFEVNTGSVKSYEMVYRENHNNDKFYQVKFCDKENKDLSLLHLMLKHAEVPGWSIGYIDDVTPNKNDPTLYLKDEVFLFNIETQNVYSTLTQDVAKAFYCVFEFDTKNLKINAYRVETLGKDTNVYLGFRNLQDNISISHAQDLYTAYYVTGKDGLTFEQYNLGKPTITDISYFLTERYMPKTLIEKYKAWKEYEDEQRPVYAKLSKEYNALLTQLSELMNRVPIDGTENDWQHADVEDLKTGYNDYTAIITGLENLYVDEDGNFDLEALKKSPDWELYSSIMNYILPQIVSALQAKEDADTITKYGSGNLLQNPNPVTMDKFWDVLNSAAENSCVEIEDSPAWGITRGLKGKLTASGTIGFEQKNIQVMEGSTYVLSGYIKSTTASVRLSYGTPGEGKQNADFPVVPNTWTRVFFAFQAKTKIAEVAYSTSGNSGDEFIVCGMQYEMGNQPSSFGYFIQREEVLFAYETDWDLFGIVELKAKLNSYNDAIKTLEFNGYNKPNNDLIDVDEDFQNQMYQQYLDYKKLATDCQAALDARQSEYDTLKKKQDDIQKQRIDIAASVAIDKFGEIQDVYESFTEDEMLILNSLYSQTNYENVNILTTTLDSLSDIVDVQQKLYEDAVEQLYADSHPQYVYTDKVDNLYSMPEFKDFHDDLDVNNFLRVAIRDDYCVKLRAISISYNPCVWNNEIEISFSNMTRYKSNIDDFVDIIGDGITSTKRQVVGGANEQITTYALTPEIISQLLRSSTFKNYMNNWSGGIIGTGSGSLNGSGGTATTVTAEAVITALLKATKAEVEELKADSAFITYLETSLISADKIVTNILEADEAKIKELAAEIINATEINAEIGNIKNLLAGNAGVGELSTIHLTASNAYIDELVVTNMIAAKMSIADLKIHTATSDEFSIISDDSGKPTISFKGSTQQFYDSNGDVRVQIGQDGNGDFNFVVRGEDGKTAIFDSTGIKAEGIPNNIIVNDMIHNGTIGKDKLGFQIVETTEDGKVDITNIVMNGKEFGVQFTEFENKVLGDIENLTGLMRSINLSGDQIFTDDGTQVLPSSITIIAATKNTSVETWYIDDQKVTIFVSPDKTSITIPATYMANKDSITVKAESADGEVYDVMTVYRLISGSSNITPVITSSRGTDFVSDTAIENTTLSCTVYKGSDPIEANSYTWYQRTDEQNDWAYLGTQETILVYLSNFENICAVKCEVDVG